MDVCKKHITDNQFVPLNWHRSINYGDQLSEYIAHKLSGLPVKYTDLNTPNFMNIGSIMSLNVMNSVICGNGYAYYNDPVHKPSYVFSVRGPLTAKKLRDNNIKCPEVYGDPALLMPLLYHPEVPKIYNLGIIPHIIDYDDVKNIIFNNVIPEGWTVIDLKESKNNTIEDITKKIIQCKQTISSSLHGIVVSHAYNIPCNWVKFSNHVLGDGFKFHDYFESVGIEKYVPTFINNIDDIRHEKIHELNIQIQTIQEKLLKNCPYYIKCTF
jgi:hypothetical protein